MCIILLLSGLLLAVSGLFLIGGYLEHRKSLLILDNLAYIILRIQKKWEEEQKEFKHEGTDTD